MKLFYLLVALIILCSVVVIYSDYQNEQMVYQFCGELAQGNSMDEARKLALERQLAELPIVDPHQLFLGVEAFTPWNNSYYCVVTHDNRKITDLQLVQQ